jgi:hypothetical protein
MRRLTSLLLIIFSASLFAQSSRPTGLRSTPSAAVTGLTVVVEVAGTPLIKGSGNPPIPKAVVRVQHWDFSNYPQDATLVEDALGVTDAAGTFSVQLPEGIYEVFASAPSFQPEGKQCDVHTGYMTPKVFRLSVVGGSGLEWGAAPPR